MTKTKKHLSIFIFLPILVVFGLLMFFIKNRQSNSINKEPVIGNNDSKSESDSDWKTYTHDRFKYIFDYPPEWIVQEIQPSSPGQEPYLSIFTPFNKDEKNGVVIGKIIPYKNNMQNFLSRLSAKGKRANLIKINGNDAYKYEALDENTIIKYLYFQTGNFVQEVNFVILDTPYQNENVKDVEKLVSSFEY